MRRRGDVPEGTRFKCLDSGGQEIRNRPLGTSAHPVHPIMWLQLAFNLRFLVSSQKMMMMMMMVLT